MDKFTDEAVLSMIDIYEEALQKYMGHGITALFNAIVITFLVGYFWGIAFSVGLFAYQMNKTQNAKNSKLTQLTKDMIR